MSTKVNNIEFRGKKANQKQSKSGIAREKKFFQTIFDKQKNPPFGKLGSPFLTPPSKRNQWGLAQQKPWKPIEKFNPTAHLSDEEKVKRISEQLSDSVQKQLDAAFKNHTENTRIEKNEKERSGNISTGEKVLYAVVSFSIVGGLVYWIFTNKSKATPKAA